MIPAATLRRLWRTMPDRQSLSYQASSGIGTYSTATTLMNAWWRPGGTREQSPSAGVYLAFSRDWYIPRESLSTMPTVSSLLTNSTGTIDPTAITWTILDVSEVGALGCWKCGTISLQLQSALRQTVTFTRPTTGQDSAGRQALASYTNVAVNVPCRLQPEDGSVGNVHERTTIPYRYTLVLGTRTAVRAKDVATISSQAYTVISSEMPQRLDQLQVVTVELILP